MATNPPIAFPIGGIDDGGVRLRFRTDADLPAIVEACRDPAIVNHTRVPEDYDFELAREFAARAEREVAAGESLSLIVVDADSDELLGSIGIVALDAEERHCEIGYWLAPWARGRGIMTRSIRLLCRWIFDELGILRIAAFVEPDNLASQRTVERAGFTREGLMRSLFENKGRRRDAISFSLLPHEMPQGD